MSSSYKLDHVISECIDNRISFSHSNTKSRIPQDHREIYDSSWSVLNSWIESRLAKQKGAGVSGFGCFCWEIKQKNGETMSRPVFIISDAFVKNFKVKKERTFKIPRTTSIEEVNYSLLAIKYSKSLTKDMVFTSIRDIIKKIGDFIYRGYEIAIEFTFGVLLAKDKRVKFEFNIQRLQQILPDVSADAGIFSLDEKLVDYNDFSEDRSDNGITSARDLYSRGESKDKQQMAITYSSDSPLPTPNTSTSTLPILPTLRLSTAVPKEGLKLQPPQKESDFDQFVRQLREEEQGQDSEEVPDSEEADMEELRALLDTLGRNKNNPIAKKEWQEGVRNRVIEQAYMRCLSDLQQKASNDESVAKEANKLYDSYRQGLLEKREIEKQKNSKVKIELDQQVQTKMRSKELEHQDKLNTVIKVLLDDHTYENKEKKIQNSKELEKQIVENEKIKKKLKSDAVSKERDYLKQLSLEIELSSAVERAKHLEKQKDLLESWERDGHIRNLHKVEPYGPSAVKEYIQRNLTDPSSSLNITTLTVPPKTSVGFALSKSIGYDPRTGKR